MSKTVKEILACIEPDIQASVEKELKEIQAFASVDCGTGDVEGNAKVVALTDAMLEEIPGIEIRHVETPSHGSMVIGTLNRGNPNGKIILSGHLDTVFKKGDVANHPFRIEGDIGYGLGAADCKGGIVVAINAVKILCKHGLLPDKEIRFLFNSDEEVGSPQSKDTLRKEAEGAIAALVFEAARGNDGILTSRKGLLIFTIETHGKSAHSGTSYTEGRSAVIELAKKIVSLYEYNDDIRGVQFNLTEIKDGGKPVNIVPDYAAASGSVRFQNQAEYEYILNLLEEIKKPYIDGCTTEVTIGNSIEAMDRSEKNVELYHFIKKVGEELGVDLEEQHSFGSGDSGTFTTIGIPCVDGLGPHMYKIHTFDESFRVSSVAERTRLVACILASM